MSLRLAIVEDEDRDREKLLRFLRQGLLPAFPDAAFLGYNSSEDFLCDWPQALDVIFLDIQMQGMDGLSLARRIRERDQGVILVFVTNAPQYSREGYDVEAADYILKPLEGEAVARLLSRLLRRLEQARPALLRLRTSEGISLVNMGDIRYVELDNRRLHIHTAGETITSSLPIQELENRLPKNVFFRCHSSFIVNLSAVKRLKGNDVILAEAVIPVSKHRRRDFVNALMDYVGDRL